MKVLRSLTPNRVCNVQLIICDGLLEVNVIMLVRYFMVKSSSGIDGLGLIFLAFGKVMDDQGHWPCDGVYDILESLNIDLGSYGDVVEGFADLPEVINS